MRKKALVTAALAAVFTACCLLALASAAGVGATVQNTNSSTTENRNGGANSNGSMAALSSNDRKFMMMAAEGGMAEVEMARVAVERASSDAVKQYAQKMIEDHTRAGEELMQLALAKGVTLPAGPNPKQRALVEKLKGMTAGAAFDAMYVREAGVKSHEKMEKLFRDEAGKGRDSDAKAFAVKTLPVVREHLGMARGMLGGMSGAKGGNSNMNMGNSNSNMNR